MWLNYADMNDDRLLPTAGPSWTNTFSDTGWSTVNSWAEYASVAKTMGGPFGKHRIGNYDYRYNALLLCPSSGGVENPQSDYYNYVPIIVTYSYNGYFIDKTRQYGHSLDKITQLANFASKALVLIDDWRPGKSDSLGRIANAQSITTVSDNNFLSIGTNGAHGRNANQLFADGHAEGKDTIIVEKDENSLRFWKTGNSKEFAFK